MDVDDSASGSQNPNNRDDPIMLSRDFAADLSHVKSYVCAFCKRGFSNAQALGGHMNIHRRDRARLRISEFDDSDDTKDENLLSLDIKSTDHTTSSQVNKDQQVRDRGNKILSLKGNLERLLGKVPHDDHQCSSDNEVIIEPSLDLELRLGHDAYDAKMKK